MNTNLSNNQNSANKISYQAIIFLGPPGSGKGTQADLLAKRLDFYHLETSELIEKKLSGIKSGAFEIVDGQKYFLEEEKRLRESGEIMSPYLIASWVKNKVRRLANDGEGVIFSGSPRTLQEAQEVIPLLKELYGRNKIIIISVKQNLEVSLHRNSKRRTCSLMRHPILFNEETAGLTICPLDGSALVARKDDDPEIIKARLKKYKERTLPVINYLKTQDLIMKEVDGERNVSEVFNDIIAKIG
ncbi:MAG: nucleoside monophosphate kinase [bacterium]